MLRCTLAGLLPLMKSRKYKEQIPCFLERYKITLSAIVQHGSWYVLRELPQQAAYLIVLPKVPAILKTQNTKGMWKKKESERISYDLLFGLKHAGLLEGLMAENRFMVNPQHWLEGRTDFYSLLDKEHVFGIADEKDHYQMGQFAAEVQSCQQTDGSWEESLISTCVNMQHLIELGVDRSEPSIMRGVAFLFSNFHREMDAWHLSTPYGLKAKCFFSTENRDGEFAVAQRLRPEWIPRNVCFRHVAIQQHAECLRLLLSLGYEGDARIDASLEELYGLLECYGGLCDTDIKKAYQRK